MNVKITTKTFLENAIKSNKILSGLWNVNAFFIKIEKMGFFPPMVEKDFTDRTYSLDILLTLSGILSPVQ